MKYRMISGKFYRYSEQGTQRFVPGDVVLDLTESELKAFGDLMEPVIETAETPASTQTRLSGSEIVLTMDLKDLPNSISRLKQLLGEMKPVEEPEPPATLNSGKEAGENAEKLAEPAATIDSGEGSTPEEAKSGAEEPAGEPVGEPETVSTETPAALLAKRLGPEIMLALEAGGICTLDDLVKVAADPDALAKIKGIGKAKAKQIREEMMALGPDPEG